MIRFNVGNNSLDFSDEMHRTVVISPKELIIQIHKTILPSDDIVQSTGSVTALYLKSAYLQDVTSKSFHLPKIPLQ